MSLQTPITILTLQRKLYRKAKAEPAFRFYKGSGDPTLATSFKCVADELSDFNETPAPKYGP